MGKKGNGQLFKRWNNDPFNQTAFENNAAYTEYFLKILDIAINRFKWHNLPESVDERYLELMLITQGSAVFFEDSDLGFVALGASYQGDLDYYGIPKERQAIAANGKPFLSLDMTNSVLVFNNRLRTADSPIIYIYANRLWEIQRSIETNAAMQKFSNIVLCSQEERLSFQNVMKEWQGNQPLIFASNALNMDAFKTINFDTPFVAKDLLDIKNAIYSEALTALGVYNSGGVEKRERMITGEVMAMNGAIELTRQSYLNARQQACDEINRIFGLNLSVEFNSNISLAPENMREKEVPENEQVYNAT